MLFKENINKKLTQEKFELIKVIFMIRLVVNIRLDNYFHISSLIYQV